MDLYTLDENFLRRDIIDDFASAIWTERYSKAGDLTLIVPPTEANIAKFPEGTLVALTGSKEVMLIDTILNEKGQLKLTGYTLELFLNERIIRTSASHSERGWTIDGVPGQIMGTIVQQMCISGVWIADTTYGMDGPREVIPNLSLGTLDTSGSVVYYPAAFGPVYDALEQLATSYSLGQSLYLDSATEAGYSLKYTVWAGRDLTSDQSVNPVVRFSPSMDTLANVKELRSISGYKNVAYAFAPNLAELATGPGIAYADNAAQTSTGFNRRVLMVFADDITTEMVGGDANLLDDLLDRRAKDALANNNFVKVIDGEVVPQAQFQYGVDYKLGDIIELEANGLAQHARITEYIRTQDRTGERAYPTVSVI